MSLDLSLVLSVFRFTQSLNSSASNCRHRYLQCVLDGKFNNTGRLVQIVHIGVVGAYSVVGGYYVLYDIP